MLAAIAGAGGRIRAGYSSTRAEIPAWRFATNLGAAHSDRNANARLPGRGTSHRTHLRSSQVIAAGRSLSYFAGVPEERSGNCGARSVDVPHVVALVEDCDDASDCGDVFASNCVTSPSDVCEKSSYHNPTA